MNMLMVKALFKKTTLFTAAFVLAVSTLTAVVPFILSKQANAIGGLTVSDIANYTDLKSALANSEVGFINLAAGIVIDTPEELVLSRSNVHVNGNDTTLNYTGANPAGWDGIYVFQAYDVTNVEINSLRVTGGDAGILINGSEVTLKGNTHVLDNQFGGIEVSKGSAANVSKLTLQGNFWDGSNSEAAGKPAIWVVNGQGSVDQTNFNSQLTAATHIKSDQTQYYLKAANTGTAATNTTRNTTFATLEAATAAATYGDTIELNKNVALTQMVFINKGLTVDGKGYTVTAPYSYTTNGVDNAVLTINGNDVTLKNVTTDSTSAGQHPHGLSVHNSTGVKLENLTFKNGRAGATIVKSAVVAKNIHTVNNIWGGVNVDNGGTSASFTISGLNTHDDAGTVPAIWIDNPVGVSVVDTDNQYVKKSIDAKIFYTLDLTAPVVTVTNPVEGSYSNTPVEVKATITDNNLRHYFYQVTRNNIVIADNIVLSAGISNTTLYTATQDGVYTVVVAARDQAGGGESTGHQTTAPLLTFTIDNQAPEVVNEPETNAPQAQANDARQTDAAPTFGFPLTRSPVATVLGDNTVTDNNAAVEGVSTENENIFAAANTEANKGTFLGMSWYLWLLIIAAIAAIAWWIGAAIRKRQA